jgi:hypothetical protein
MIVLMLLLSIYTRVTYYNLNGVMADGSWTHTGAAACGSAIPPGSTVVIHADYDVYVLCEDTGVLAPYQVDVWSTVRPDWLVTDYYDVEIE